MRYKIPVQIENEDTIFLGLSLRQLAILMLWGGLAYSVFKNLEKTAGGEIALVPTVIICVITIFVALFKHSEMTFLPFILNAIRLNLNTTTRVWEKWASSFSVLEIGYSTSYSNTNTKIEHKASTHEVFSEVEDKLKNL